MEFEIEIVEAEKIKCSEEEKTALIEEITNRMEKIRDGQTSSIS